MADEVHLTVFHTQLAKPMVMVRPDKSIWLVIQLRWWDLATLLWWWMYPSSKRARVQIQAGDEGLIGIRCHAIRLADDSFESRS